MKGLDLRKFKKVSSDKHTTTLEHPDGHRISIAHSKLKGDLKTQLEKLPAYSEGGSITEAEPTVRPDAGWGKITVYPKTPEVPNYDAGGMIPETENPDTAKSTSFSHGGHQWTAAELTDIGKIGNKIAPSVAQELGAPPPDAASEPPMENINLGAPQAPPPGSPTTPIDPTQPLTSALGMQQSGLQAEAAAHGQLGQEQAKLAHEQATKQQDLQNTFQNESKAVLDDYSNLIKDVKAGHIDPNRYWNSKSDLGKVSSAIGLLLGGMGAGLTGKDNPAMTYLHNQIERDIDAQKTGLANKNNLMHALQAQYGNIKDASNMARAFYADQYAAKIQEAAARSTDPIAKARAQQAIGQLKAQYAPMLMETAQRQAVWRATQSGQLEPEKAIPFLVPKEHQSEAFKEAKEHQVLKQSVDNVTSAMNKVAQLQSVGGRLSSPLQSKSQIDALNLQIDSMAKEMFGKVSDQEIQMLHNAKIGLSDSPATIQQKISVLKNSLGKRESSPTLKAYGINLKPATSSPNVQPINAPGSYNRK